MTSPATRRQGSRNATISRRLSQLHRMLALGYTLGFVNISGNPVGSGEKFSR